MCSIISHRLGDSNVSGHRSWLTHQQRQVSFHPAGHIIPGSCQIRVEHKNEVWVFTGDYKRRRKASGISTHIDLLKCDTFKTE
jgi:putative mRNA 3-end processing factor